VAVLPNTTMPAETAPHARTLMAWPTVGVAAMGLWGDAGLAGARSVYAQIARTIAGYEPVTMIAAPADAEAAEQECGPTVEIVALPIDDSWIRDSGPIVVVAADGSRHALHFRFNAWGEKWSPWDDDAAVGALIAPHLGLPVHEIPMVLEGGSIAIDGAGTLVTTERCLLNPNRNPRMSRAEIEHTLKASLGVENIVWLADAIAEDDGTDGHVDNVVAFTAPGHALVQGCADPENPNRALAIDNVQRLDAMGITVTEVPVLPYAQFANGRRVPVPYVNLYALNGAIVVPTADDPADADALAIIAAHYPGREIVAVPGAVLAHGGGGVHCITQQVPA
jgi:agmatine deiminase